MEVLIPTPTPSSHRSQLCLLFTSSLSRADACTPPSLTNAYSSFKALFRHHFLRKDCHDSSQPQAASRGFPGITCRTVALLDSPRQGAGQIQCPTESQAYRREKDSPSPNRKQLCLFLFYVLGFHGRICWEKNVHCHKSWKHCSRLLSFCRGN